ncbi:glycosyltransferase [Sphingomonas aurantiaca]|uniref:glycosyltransferase n=1 Tax=Sphingomonas aurantiaca TaxID=185949 RepID=UPI002FE339A5
MARTGREQIRTAQRARSVTPVPFCVCVPARNESQRLPVLLDALAAQTIAGRIPVALCINNSDDDSVAVVEQVARHHAERLVILVDACTLPPPLAHAGGARGRAMEMGYRHVRSAAGGNGVLISTDADCRPPAEWISANLAAIGAGAGIVGGRIMLDDAEPIHPAIARMRDRFDLYWAAVRAIEDASDPSPHDPPPRHGDHTGASIAIDAGLYRAIGGVPSIASGEDQSMVIAAVAAGGRLVHPPSVWTRVSARTDGRAAGGMAIAMAELAATMDRGVVPYVPAFEHWHARALWRRATRTAYGVAEMLAQEAELPPMPADMPLPASPPEHDVSRLRVAAPTLS